MLSDDLRATVAWIRSFEADGIAPTFTELAMLANRLAHIADDVERVEELMPGLVEAIRGPDDLSSPRRRRLLGASGLAELRAALDGERTRGPNVVDLDAYRGPPR